MKLAKQKTHKWRQREYSRFADGTYRPVPWEGAGFCRLSAYAGVHLAHSERKERKMIAYTPDYKKGYDDVRVVLKPRKYLKKFYPCLTDKEVEMWAEKFQMSNETYLVLFAYSSDAIRWVYQHCHIGCDEDTNDGTGSCMTYVMEKYNSNPIHPVEAYGYGDLAIAYIIYPGDEKKPPEAQRVRTRGLVWPAKKTYGRIFGKNGWEDRLRIALEAQGYQPEMNGMKGAKIKRISFFDPSIPEDEHVFTNKIIVPYLDCVHYLWDDNDEYLTIGEPNRDEMVEGRAVQKSCHYVAQSQRGVISPDWDHRWYCIKCLTVGRFPDKSRAIRNNKHLCIPCFTVHGMNCPQCGSYTLKDNCNTVFADPFKQKWCEGCVGEYSKVCSNCDKRQYYGQFGAPLSDEYDRYYDICKSCIRFIKLRTSVNGYCNVTINNMKKLSDVLREKVSTPPVQQVPQVPEMGGISAGAVTPSQAQADEGRYMFSYDTSRTSFVVDTGIETQTDEE